MANGEQWFYSDGQSQKGPVERHAIELLIAQGQIGAETLIWRNGLPAWLPARQVPEFASRFGAATPPPVPPPAPSSTPPPAAPSAASPAVTPVPPPVPPPRKGFSPLTWVALGCGCLVLLGIAAAVAFLLLAVPAVKEAVEAKDDCQAATETFLGEIAAGRHQAAYDSTDAGFRESTPLQAFAPIARGLRELGQPLQITCQEKGVITTAQYGTVQKRIYLVKYASQSIKCTFHFRQEGGKLGVLSLHYEQVK